MKHVEIILSIKTICITKSNNLKKKQKKQKQKINCNAILEN